MAPKSRIALACILSVAALGAIAPAANAYVYWANNGNGTIGRANLDGTGVNQSFISGADAPNGIAVNGSYVYWSNFASSSIGRANLDGTGVNQSFITGATGAAGIAINGSHLFWANASTSTIGRANLDGSGSPDPAFITGMSGAFGVAVDASYIYWTSSSAPAIGRANLNGTSPNYSFITNAFSPFDVAVDGTYVYWSNMASIGRANLIGTAADQLFVTGANTAYGVAVDSGHVYWTNQGADSIGRAGINGSATDQSFLTGANVPRAIAVDSLQPAGSLSPSTYDYGAVKASGGEKQATFTLTSNGNTPLTLDGISISGADGENFGILGDGTCVAGVTSLSNGQSCTVAVNFGPLSTGSKTALLDIGTNAGLKTVSLSGTGVPAPALVPVRTTKLLLKVKIGCGDADACSVRLTGKKVGSKAAVVPKTVAVGAGQQPTVTLAYSAALKKALRKGGKVRVTATRQNATGATKAITLTVRK